MGVLGTVSAAAISGWSSRQQLRAQAGIDHAQWRRQARRDAYSAFLAPAHEAGTALKQAARALIGDADTAEADRRLLAAHDHLTAVHAAWAALAVEGPEAVEQLAHGVKTALHSMQTTLLAWRDSAGRAADHHVKFVERHAVEVTRVSERIRAFTAAARDALDETTPALNIQGR